jgi:hypothetical protein
MDDALRQLIDAEPETTPRSKLEPYYDVIRELRRKRRTYQQIAQFLAEHLQLSVAPSTIHAFVAVRAKRRSRVAYELPDRTTTSTTVQGDDPAAKPGSSDAIEALRQKPKPEVAKPDFVYDPNQPLTVRCNNPLQD